jgi:DNA-binding response OmpR family regulator
MYGAGIGPLSPKSIRIIIVSASKKLTEIYANFFRVAGLKVEMILHSGEELLSYLKSSVRENLNKYLILYDYSSMKEASLDTLKQVKAVSPNNKIILLANRVQVDFEKNLELFDGVLFKPFTLNELFHEMENLAWGMER